MPISAVVREGVIQWYGNTLLSRLNSKAEDAIVIVMQRLHIDDLVGHVLADKDWEHLNLPAIAQRDELIPLGFNRCYSRRIGELLHPARESLVELDRLKREMGSMDFAAQYQQEPVPEGGNLIKWDWFARYADPPRVLPSDRIIGSWDTAMSARELSDYSVCIVFHVKGDAVFILGVIRARLEYPDLKRKVLEQHWRWSNLPARYSLLIENKGSGMTSSRTSSENTFILLRSTLKVTRSCE